MHKALLVKRVLRQTDQHDIRLSHSFDDFLLPVLPREQVFLVKPGGEVVGDKLLVELAHGSFVFGGVAEEDAQWVRRWVFGCWFGHASPL
jgi:hypothetical protein